MILPRIAIALMGLATTGTPAVLRAEAVSCPAAINVKEQLDAIPPAGWKPSVDVAPRYLAGVTFFDGDPRARASIAPTRDVAATGRDRVATWDFGVSTTPVWLACRYQQTGVSLVRQLPAAYRQCTLRYGPGGIVRSLACH